MGKRDVIEDADLFYIMSTISSMAQGQPSQLIYDVTTFAGHLFKKLHEELPEVHDNTMGGFRIAIANNRKKYEGNAFKIEFTDRLSKLLDAVEAYHNAYQEFDQWTVAHDEELTGRSSSTNPIGANH
jgi:hypothetical protein